MRRILRMIGVARRLSAVAAGGWFFAGAAPAATTAPPPADDAYAEIERLAEALAVVRARYVRADAVGYPGLVNAALRGVAAELDPYCEYLEPDEVRALEEESAGEFGGVGAALGAVNGELRVVFVEAGSPADEAGLRANDVLLAADGQPFEPPDPDLAVRRLRGPPGTRVSVKLRRPPETSERTLLIERGWVRQPSIVDTTILAGNVGYVRIAAFDERTPGTLREALDELAGRGARGWVLDLRDNPGGLFDAAIDVAAQFLPRRVVAVRAEGRRPEDGGVWRAGGRGARREPLVVLINGGSASAAEIVAGALHDHGRAALVGAPSYGKGSIQSLFTLPDGAAWRLTIATYVTPAGQPIHERGLAPDVLVPEPPSAWANRVERWGGDAEEIREAAGGKADHPAPAGDAQLERAVAILRARLLRPAR